MRVPIVAVGYLGAGGALLLELTGYSSDAVYWLTSWGRTAAVFLWGVLIFLVLSEWYADAQKKREPEGEGDKISSFRWVVIWISWLAWAAATLIGIIVAWGGGRTVILEFFEALNTPFFVGNLRFQLTGFVYASLILLTTHGVSRIWRYLFKNKILASTGLESGLQESMQVTNWSFKDMRLRRNIDVGVEYGSDIELVRTSLLEVAENTPRVLKYPKPDVLFTDFGDSALIFRLRVWTVIDHMLTVETAIRFEIDRLFRERGIFIAFPQQDIHIKTVDAAFPIDIQSKARNSADSTGGS
ncbi:MAG: mechanosensitive ion channel [Desulfobacterales bacterium]